MQSGIVKDNDMLGLLIVTMVILTIICGLIFFVCLFDNEAVALLVAGYFCFAFANSAYYLSKLV